MTYFGEHRVIHRPQVKREWQKMLVQFLKMRGLKPQKRLSFDTNYALSQTTYFRVQNAVEIGDLQLVEEIVEQGFNLKFLHMTLGFRSPIPWRWEPLLMSARTPDMIVTMVGHGADINGKDDEGYTALHRALMVGYEHTEVVRTLVRAGVDASLTNNYGITAIDDAIFRRKVIMDGRCPEEKKAIVIGAMQRNVDAYVDACADELRMAAQAAFAMGLHNRLGEKTLIKMLDPEMVRMVLEYV
jgi:Ankyrin repeat